MRLLNNVAIFITLAVAYNLVNGVCGQLHLGPNAFITLGAYTAALLTMTPAEKTLNFLVTPLYWPLSQVVLPFPLALLAGGLVAAAFGLLTGFPVFRVRGDYLAIVTLGFGEVVRVLANNLQGLTNGPLGLKGLYPYTNLWWSWGVAVAATVAVVTALVNSSYGRALNAIREDEAAAKASGVNTFRHLLGAYILSAFWFGVGGGLLAHLITTISPSLFTFFLTFNLLIIIVVGGLGSTTGAVWPRRASPWRGSGSGWWRSRPPSSGRHPGHSGDAHGDPVPGAALGDHLLPPGPPGPPGVFLGRAGPPAAPGGRFSPARAP